MEWLGSAAAAMPLELELCPGRWVGGQHPCFIIAEIGQNHQGDLDVAKRMIRVAKVRGALQMRGVRGSGEGKGHGEPGPPFSVSLALHLVWRPACLVHF